MTPKEIEAARSELRRLAVMRTQLEVRLRQTVDTLRSPDMSGYCAASWQEIADDLGVTRQSAHARFAPK